MDPMTLALILGAVGSGVDVFSGIQQRQQMNQLFENAPRSTGIQNVAASAASRRGLTGGAGAAFETDATAQFMRSLFGQRLQAQMGTPSPLQNVSTDISSLLPLLFLMQGGQGSSDSVSGSGDAMLGQGANQLSAISQLLGTGLLGPGGM